MSELTTDEKFSLILQSLGKIEADIQELKAGQTRHEDLLSQLVESNKKQDHILEILTVRSVDQEAEIKMIKEAI